MSAISRIESVLLQFGDRFAGNNVSETAQQWYDFDFTADSMYDWCDIGIWDAAIASELRDADLTPDQVEIAAVEMVEEQTDPDRNFSHPDMDPIYAVCNGDLSITRFIRRCKEVAS